MPARVRKCLREEIRPISIDTAQDKQRLMAGLKNYKKIILVTPQLWMLKNIADGEDKGFFRTDIYAFAAVGKSKFTLCWILRDQSLGGELFLRA